MFSRNGFRCLLLISRRVATGYGQPPSTLYDWTLSWSESVDPNFKLPEGIKPRLEIERFCDKVTKALYANQRDPVGLCNDQERSSLISFLSRDFDELEQRLKPQNDCTLCPFDSLVKRLELTLNQVSPISICALRISIFTCQLSSTIQQQRITVNASSPCTWRRRHFSK